MLYLCTIYERIMTTSYSHKITLFLLAGLSVWFSACNQRDLSTKTDALVFNIDSTLLSEFPVTDSSLKIAIYPPKNWIPSENITHQFSKAGLAVGEIMPAHFFINMIDSSSMIITEFSDLSDEDLSIMRIDFTRIFNKNSLWNEIHHTEFFCNQFKADQFLMFNDQMVNFKLILTSEAPVFEGRKIALDYYLPRNSYIKNIRSVESSVGSLSLIN